MSRNSKLIVVILAVVAVAVWIAGRYALPEQPHRESRLLMDTVISITAFPATSAVAVDQAFAAFAAVEEMASFHKPQTQLAQLNLQGKLVPVASFAELISIARDYCRISDGYFDPSFAALQTAYGFYSGVGRLPADNEIQDLLEKHCGLEKVLQVEADNTMILASGSLLDLGGLAGGYAIERAAEILRRSGCKAFLIDDAGDIWFEGHKPDNSPWRIAVRDPRDNGVLAMVESREPLAISTSGDYERYITIEGRRYGHIMNPHTGRPVDYYSSVTIVASSAIAADALSTAVFAMPPDRAIAWCDQHNLAALILTASGSISMSKAGLTCFREVKSQ